MAVVVDAGELSRIGSVVTDQADWFARARLVNIDHHVSNPGYGEAVLDRPEAAATCELVTLLLPELGVALDAELATVLMAGIVQDTHTFAHPNATPAHPARRGRAGGGRGAAGGHQPRDLRRQAVQHARALGPDAGRHRAAQPTGASSTPRMTIAMLASTGEQPTASEGFVDLLGSTKGADVTILFKEVGPAETRVSVRTSARADAVAITPPSAGEATREPPAARSRRRSTRRASWSWLRPSASWLAAMLGVVNLDKPVGPTSHDMVDLVRRLTGMRRIGHAGTLDPLASGVLPILVGAGDALQRRPDRRPEALRGRHPAGVPLRHGRRAGAARGGRSASRAARLPGRRWPRSSGPSSSGRPPSRRARRAA